VDLQGSVVSKAKRDRYDDHDPNGAYDSEVKPDGDRSVLYFPDVDNAWFLIDPYSCGGPMIWFPAFGHDTSVPFPSLRNNSHTILTSDLEAAVNVAQNYPNAREKSDPRVSKLLENLRS
jgi:hypothetical protein